MSGRVAPGGSEKGGRNGSALTGAHSRSRLPCSSRFVTAVIEDRATVLSAVRAKAEETSQRVSGPVRARARGWRQST